MKCEIFKRKGSTRIKVFNFKNSVLNSQLESENRQLSSFIDENILIICPQGRKRRKLVLFWNLMLRKKWNKWNWG